MKRQLTVALGLAVIASPAFATKARMEALGEDTFGSYYINDNRNIFLNPARITENKDLVTYEFGESASSITAADSSAAPRAVGGFIKSHGNMVYGLHFGDSSPSTGSVRGLAGGNLQERQPWDLHVGGDAGVKWGASLTYENHDAGAAANNTRIASNGLRLRGGALMGDLDVFAQVSLNSNAKDFNGRMVEGGTGTFIGVGYMLNNYKLFADWRNVAAEYNNNVADDEDFKSSIIRLGAGRQERLNDRATLFAKAMAVHSSVEDDGTATFSAAADATEIVLPLTIGLEYAATSWLDFRGSVVHNVFSQRELDPKSGSKTTTHVANTSVRAGASLKFGEFSIDGLISTGGAGGDATDTDTAGGNGNLRTDNLMSRVSMIYRF